MHSSKLIHFFLALFLLSCCICNATAFAAELAEKGKQTPTSIKASRMEYDADRQTVIFTGNVHVKRPDFELWSATMTVYLDKSGKKNSPVESSGTSEGGMQAGEIDRIVAEKDVRMKSKEKSGTCQKATYYAKTDKFVMEGKPELRDSNKSTMRGTVITHFLKSNRSEVQNPQATFFTPEASDRSSLLPGNTPKGTNR